MKKAPVRNLPRDTLPRTLSSQSRNRADATAELHFIYCNIRVISHEISSVVVFPENKFLKLDSIASIVLYFISSRDGAGAFAKIVRTKFVLDNILNERDPVAITFAQRGRWSFA